MPVLRQNTASVSPALMVTRLASSATFTASSPDAHGAEGAPENAGQALADGLNGSWSRATTHPASAQRVPSLIAKETL